MSAYLRTERWTRNDADGVLLVDVTRTETVEIPVPLLHRMLAELGWRKDES